MIRTARRLSGSGAVWAGVEAGASALLSFVSAFVVARLVGPGELGAGAAAVALHVLLWVPVNALFADALVQMPRVTRRTASSAFWASGAFGVAGAGIEVALGPVLADTVGDPRLGAMSCVLAVGLPLVGAGGAVQGLLTRERRYRILAGRALIGQGIGTATGIALAGAGAGAWALVLQQATTSLAGAAALLLRGGFRPRLVWRAASVVALLRLGVPLTASTLVQQGRYRLFAMLIGATAGTVALGQIHMAFRLVDTVRDLVASALWRLMFPVMSRVQHDLAALQASVDRMLALSALLVFPLIGVLSMAIPAAVALLLGPGWQPAGQAARPLLRTDDLRVPVLPWGGRDRRTRPPVGCPHRKRYEHCPHGRGRAPGSARDARERCLDLDGCAAFRRALYAARDGAGVTGAAGAAMAGRRDAAGAGGCCGGGRVGPARAFMRRSGGPRGSRGDGRRGLCARLPRAPARSHRRSRRGAAASGARASMTRHIRFLGLDLSTGTLEDAVAWLQQRPPDAPFDYIVTPNADHFVRLSRTAALRSVYDGAWLRLLDSRVVARIAWLLGLRPPRVVTGADLTETILRDHLRPGESIAVVGLRPELLPVLVRRYRLSRPAHCDPPFGFEHDPDALEAVVRFVVEHPARFVFLALGSPKQEILAAAIKATNRAVGIGFCIGASLDFLTGAQTRAPRWVQLAGTGVAAPAAVGAAPLGATLPARGPTHHRPSFARAESAAGIALGGAGVQTAPGRSRNTSARRRLAGEPRCTASVRRRYARACSDICARSPWRESESAAGNARRVGRSMPLRKPRTTYPA